MRKFLFTAVFFLGSLTLFGQSQDLKKFRTGRFLLLSNTEGDCVIIRRGTHQVEFMEKTGVQATFSVKWLSDSVYTLKPTKGSVRLFPRFPKDALLTVRILEARENSYLQLTSSNFDDHKYISEIFKIED
jgi:hypothetical protein